MAYGAYWANKPNIQGKAGLYHYRAYGAYRPNKPNIQGKAGHYHYLAYGAYWANKPNVKAKIAALPFGAMRLRPNIQKNNSESVKV